MDDSKVGGPRRGSSASKGTASTRKAMKTKPTKVVYIGNPVHRTARPDEFRAVVQELTGRHSTVADQVATRAMPSTSTASTSLVGAAASSTPAPPWISNINGGNGAAAAEPPFDMFDSFTEAFGFNVVDEAAPSSMAPLPYYCEHHRFR